MNANQVSPRVTVVYRPLKVPPCTLDMPVTSRRRRSGQRRRAISPSTQNTTLAPAIPLADPVLPERSHYFDVGVVQKLLPGLEVGLAAYYKLARDQIDVGQFGQALVLNEFNYERGENRGIERK